MRIPPNLTHRPAKPALGRGRLQVAARRALILGDGMATTAQIAEWAYVRKVVRGESLDSYNYQRVRRVLAEIAEPVGRAGGRGRPLVWRLRQRLTNATNGHSLHSLPDTIIETIEEIGDRLGAPKHRKLDS